MTEVKTETTVTEYLSEDGTTLFAEAEDCKKYDLKAREKRMWEDARAELLRQNNIMDCSEEWQELSCHDEDLFLCRFYSSKDFVLTSWALEKIGAVENCTVAIQKFKGAQAIVVNAGRPEFPFFAVVHICEFDSDMIVDPDYKHYVYKPVASLKEKLDQFMKEDANK